MKYFYVISHTHWDREWYQPLEIFQLRLVDLIDRCLITLAENADYIFHLDAQTVVLEDYLAFRPSKRNELQKFIMSGQLIIGPWYLQNDFYLTSGEATIRNLLEGTRIAAEFGKCSHVGYAADQFGNISQIPQILSGFGIDNFVFGRGFSEYYTDANGKERLKANPSEFIWEGADGTKLLAIHMKYWYNNAQRFSADIAKSRILVDVMEGLFEGIATTPYILMMNGVDHLEAQADLLPILNKLDKDIGENRHIAQYSLHQYVDKVREYISCENIVMHCHKGEMRLGHDKDILKGTLSSRAYLKCENVKAQVMMENKLEPLYSMMVMSGADGAYPLDHFRYLWKSLMKNHPHDSICGCSRDEVHAHMEDNFSRLSCMSNELLRKGLVQLSQHLLIENINKNDYFIMLVNTTQRAQSGVINMQLDFPATENINAFTICDKENRPVSFELILKENATRDIFSPLNLPGVLEVNRYNIRVTATNILPYSAEAYKVVKSEMFPFFAKTPTSENNLLELENEYIKIKFDNCGKVDYYNKNTGENIIGLTEIEDTADRGDSYVYMASHEAAVLGSNFASEVELLVNTPLCKSVCVTTHLKLPAEYDFENLCRSSKTEDCTVALTYTLHAQSQTLEIAYNINNKAKDHRVRLLIRTGIETQFSTADIPFDIVTHHADDHYTFTQSKVRPNSSFALLEDDNKGIAVFTQGEHEYEHIANEQTLAFTLMRATGLISRELDLKPTAGEEWVCPQNQCLRILGGSIGVFAYKNNYLDAHVPVLATQFRTGLLSSFQSYDSKKFSGGRTAVQDTRLEELFYLPDEFPDFKIANRKSVFKIHENDDIIITAFKKSENGEGLILRLLNIKNCDCDISLNVNFNCYLCALDESKKDFLGKGNIDLSFHKKEIKTLLIVK